MTMKELKIVEMSAKLHVPIHVTEHVIWRVQLPAEVRVQCPV